MRLPVMPPVSPMLAKAVPVVPDPGSMTAGLLFEPKWDVSGRPCSPTKG